jgi:carbohydrate kinase (thermoresistant glucokinase family)
MVIVLKGPMGCGKTTIGKLVSASTGWRFADGDDFHPPGNIGKMAAGIPLDDDDRLPWLRSLGKLISRTIADGENLILACSALKRQYRTLLGIDQKQVVSVYLKGTPELLQQRIAGRTNHYMNKDLLTSQLQTLEEPRDGLIMSIADKPENIARELTLRISTKNFNQ